MKKMNNKGFSLVELIVVVAIMAVLVGVLAPTLLRYVEKTRLQKDNSAISEICQAAKIAMADEAINNAVSASTWTVTTTSKTYTFNSASTAHALEQELAAVIGSSVTLTSNTYTSAPSITVSVSGTTPSISVTNWIENVGDAASTKTDW